MQHVSGKVILITGGAGGIGSAMVKELLQNGAKGVAIVDICQNSADLTFERTIFLKTDVTKKAELEDAFDKTIQTFSQLDIVINNAGIVDEFDWKKTVAVNLVAVVEGTYLAMQKYLPKYRSGPEGVIVNTASVLGLTVVQSIPVYCATKHGLIGLGKSLGGDEFYKEYKVRVVTLLPGVVRTPLGNNIGDPSKTWFSHRMEEDFKAFYAVEQEPERVGKALIEAIQNGKPGSLWVIEDDEPFYEVLVPSYRSMKKSSD